VQKQITRHAATTVYLCPLVNHMFRSEVPANPIGREIGPKCVCASVGPTGAPGLITVTGGDSSRIDGELQQSGGRGAPTRGARRTRAHLCPF